MIVAHPPGHGGKGTPMEARRINAAFMHRPGHRGSTPAHPRGLGRCSKRRRTLAILIVWVLPLALSCQASSGSPAREPRNTSRLVGTVVEQFQGGGYTYLLVKTDEGERWAAIPAATAFPLASTVALVSCVTVREHAVAESRLRQAAVAFCAPDSPVERGR